MSFDCSIKPKRSEQDVGLIPTASTKFKWQLETKDGVLYPCHYCTTDGNLSFFQGAGKEVDPWKIICGKCQKRAPKDMVRQYWVLNTLKSSEFRPDFNPYYKK